jgi:hypothetical protein
MINLFRRLIILSSLLFFGCDKDSPFKDYSDPYPKVQTLEAVAGVGDTIILAGECTSEGKLPLQYIGFYFDTDPNPKMNRQEVYEPFIGKFGSKIGGLSPDSTYYYVAFAVNDLGYSKGEVKSFKVGKPTPQIAPCDLDENTAIVNGNNVNWSYPTATIENSDAVVSAESYLAGIAVTIKFNDSKIPSGKYTTSSLDLLPLGARNVLVTIRNAGAYTEIPVDSGAIVYVAENTDGTVTVSFCDLKYKSNNLSKTISVKIKTNKPKTTT